MNGKKKGEKKKVDCKNLLPNSQNISIYYSHSSILMEIGCINMKYGELESMKIIKCTVQEFSVLLLLNDIRPK